MENLKWIKSNEECQNPLFRKEFTAEKTIKATLTICGLGFFEAYLNGKRLPGRLKPLWTDFEERKFDKLLYPTSDSFAHRIYFIEYDITKYLQDGKNVLAIMLGNGWYIQNKRVIEGDLSYGDELKTAFELKVESVMGLQKIQSGEDTLCSSGAIYFNNIFYGDKIDFARYQRGWNEINFDDGAWGFSKIAKTPITRFFLQECENDDIIEKWRPELMFSKDGWDFYDCKKCFSGFVNFIAKNDCKHIELKFAEEIKDGDLDYNSAGGDVPEQIQTDEYINVPKGQVCEPVFSIKGFRYFKITSDCGNNFECNFVSINVNLKAKFKSNNEILNWYYNATVGALYSNIHYGVPSDCPHRERIGYTGDGQGTANIAMKLGAFENFYKKWIYDIIDCQDVATGHVQHTAPFYGGGGGPGGWGGAIVIVPYFYYKHYGNKELILDCIHPITEFFKSLETFSENDLVVREIEGGWCLGDWSTPRQPEQISAAYVNTYYYIKCMEYAQELAEFVGVKLDLSQTISRKKEALKNAFYDPITHDFNNNSNGANVFALDIGIADDNTWQKTIAHYKQTKHFDTGIFGTGVLCDVLAARGEKKLLYEIMSSTGFPSFGYMKEGGATTLWESWIGGGSHNHHMFGGTASHLFTALLGIGQKGIKHSDLIIEPADIDGLCVSGTMYTASGIVSVDLQRVDNIIEIIINNPNEQGVLKFRGKSMELVNGYNKFSFKESI